MVKAER